jgi:hypothetical protein
VQNRVLIYAEALDVAAEGAVWYARRIGDGTFDALHVPIKGSDTGIHARWFDYTGGDSKLDVRPRGTDATKAVLGEIARLRGDDPDVVVTVVLPEQYSKRSLVLAAQRAQFRLKLRLLTEPGVVVADLSAVTSERHPEGRLPERLAVRVLAGDIDGATRRAVEYARLLGGDDLRAVHFGDRGWDAAELAIPVEDAPLDGPLTSSILTYLRGLTDDPGTAVGIVLPERLQPNLRWLRSRRALAIKRCLLFEPHVILSSVPFQA